MSNRKNHSRAQRIWRKLRKMSTADLMLSMPIFSRGEQIVIWRPDEIRTTITNIRTDGRMPVINCRFETIR